MWIKLDKGTEICATSTGKQIDAHKQNDKL